MENREHSKTIDPVSFKLGMIFCFAEMVASGVKKIALSPPMSPVEYKGLQAVSDRIAKRFNLQSYLEKSIIITELFTEADIRNMFDGIIHEEMAQDIWVILYFRDETVLRRYLTLKEQQKHYLDSGCYNALEKKEIALEFGRLLSYPDDEILQMLSSK